MKSEQEVRKEELDFIKKRIELIKKFNSVIQTKDLIENSEITADVVIVFDSIFEQRYELLKQFKKEETSLCLVYCGSQFLTTNFTNYENTKKAMKVIDKKPEEKGCIPIGKVLIALINQIKWNSIQKHIIFVFNKQHSLDDEIPIGLNDYFKTNEADVTISILLTRPELYEQVVGLQDRCFGNAKILLQHNIEYLRKPTDGKEESTTGYIIDIPKEFWEEEHFGEYNSPTMFSVRPINVKRKMECNRWSEDHRFAEYDCNYDGLDGVLMKEMNEERRELAMSFEEIIQRSWCTYMAEKFNEGFVGGFKNKTIKIIPRRIFVEKMDEDLFRNEPWHYTKEEITRRLEGKEIYFIQPKAKGKKSFVGKDCNKSPTLECFMHWSYYESNENGIVRVEKGRFHRKDNQYEIEECYVVHKDPLKFFFTGFNRKEKTFTFFTQHYCNIHCKRMNLPKHKDQPQSDNPMIETVLLKK